MANELIEVREQAKQEIPNDGDRCIVEEWCDRYRLGLDTYDDAAIMRLALRLYRAGRIPQTSNAIIDWKGRRL